MVRRQLRVPRGCFDGNRLCSGSAPWLRPGARLSKSSECTARTERKGEGSPRGSAGSERGRFPKRCLAGFCRHSLCPGGTSLCPQVAKAARGAIPCALPRPPALLLACYLGRQLHSPEVSAFFQQGLTQPQVLFGACSGAPLRLVTGWGTPSFTPALLRAAPGSANGPLILLAAGLDWGSHQGRGTNLQLSGGCGG